MPNLLNTCEDCVSLVYQECEDIQLSPQSGITANTLYYWRVEDQHGNVWKGSATSSANGVVTIPESAFPVGMFYKGIGSLKVELRLNEIDTETVAMMWNGVSYDCVNVSFEDNQTLEPYGY